MKTYILLSGVVILVFVWTLGGAVVCNADVVALWLFDEKSGDEVIDSSGNKNHGTIHDAKWVDGKFGSALEFDGEKSYVEIPESDSLNVTEVSWHAWIMVTGKQATDRVIFAESDNGGFGGRIWREEKFSCWVRVDGDWRYPASLANIPDLYNTWHHVATTYNSKTGEQKMYVDSVLGSEGKLALANLKIQPGIGTSEIGNRHEWGQGFKGIIDELCIYNIVLTEDEIQKSTSSSLSKTAVESSGKLAITWGSVKFRGRKNDE